MTDSFVFADLALSRRLEHAEALSNSRFVDARARLVPDCGATWVAVAGALALCDGVAHLAGASTMPDGRKRGAQLALLGHRLRYAAAHGCDVALMAALPGSSSQRNAERNGFRIAYTRIKWQRI